MKRDNSGNRNSHFPILHIIGLPGAGKTTLAKRLSRKLNLPVFQIESSWGRTIRMNDEERGGHGEAVIRKIENQGIRIPGDKEIGNQFDQDKFF